MLPLIAGFGAASYLMEVSNYFAIIIVLVMGIYGYKTSFILHDCAHNSLFRSKNVNLWVGRVGGWFVGVNYDVFAATHILHHRNNGQELDPQDIEVRRFEGQSLSGKLWYIISPLFFGRVFEFLSGYSGQYLNKRPSTQSAPGVAELVKKTTPIWVFGTIGTQVFLGSIVSNFGANPINLLLYPFAACTLALFLARLRTLSEHIRPPGAGEDFARSHKPNWFDALVLYDAHFNYHLEHHLVPHVPSNKLNSIFKTFGDDYHEPRTLGTSMVSTIFNNLGNPKTCPNHSVDRKKDHA